MSFAESEVQAGRLLPKDKNMCVAALETLSAASDAVSFGEGGQAARITPLKMRSWLQGQMSSCRAVIDFGDRAASFDARGKTDDELHQAALAYQAAHPGVNYAEAVGRVVSFCG